VVLGCSLEDQLEYLVGCGGRGSGGRDRSARQRIRKVGAANGPELAGCIDGRQENAISFEEYLEFAVSSCA
jgi:hypothetical protein